MNRKELAEQFSKAFDRKERGEEKITVLREGSPEWMKDAIYAAHEALVGMLPNNWVYAACASAADFLAENDPPEEWEDLAGDFADQAVEIYTANLYQWAADHGNFRELIEEARENWGPGKTHDEDISRAQFIAYERIYHVIREAIEEQADDE